MAEEESEAGLVLLDGCILESTEFRIIVESVKDLFNLHLVIWPQTNE